MKFTPLRFSWLALPPKPRAIVVVLGGAFFGTFPTLFYRRLLRDIHDAGFGVLALPFRFTFQHWDVALSLAIDKSAIEQDVIYELNQRLLAEGEPACTQIPTLWLAHSLGCKYVALLELLTDTEVNHNRAAVLAAFKEASPAQAAELSRKLEAIDMDRISLSNQPQILIDPVIADLEGAVPFEPLKKLFDRLLKVIPSRETTFNLIGKSSLFNLTTIVDLHSQLAANTIQCLMKASTGLKRQCVAAHVTRSHFWLGRHLCILGVRETDSGISEQTVELLTHALAQADTLLRP